MNTVLEQPQLIGHLAGDHSVNPCLLRAVEQTRARRPPSIISLQAAKTTVSRLGACLLHKPKAHAEHLRRLDLRHPIAHRQHYLSANVRLSCRIQLPSVIRHACIISCKHYFVN